MRHDRGMIDQAFDAAQAFRERKQVRILQESSRPFKIRFQNNRHNPAESTHLLAGEVMMRMRFEPGIVN